MKNIIIVFAVDPGPDGDHLEDRGRPRPVPGAGVQFVDILLVAREPRPRSTSEHRSLHLRDCFDRRVMCGLCRAGCRVGGARQHWYGRRTLLTVCLVVVGVR